MYVVIFKARGVHVRLDHVFLGIKFKWEPKISINCRWPYMIRRCSPIYIKWNVSMCLHIEEDHQSMEEARDDNTTKKAKGKEDSKCTWDTTHLTKPTRIWYQRIAHNSSNCDFCRENYSKLKTCLDSILI